MTIRRTGLTAGAIVALVAAGSLSAGAQVTTSYNPPTYYTPPAAAANDGSGNPVMTPGQLPPEATQYLQAQQQNLMNSYYGGAYNLPGMQGALPPGMQQAQDDARKKEQKTRFVYDPSRRDPLNEAGLPPRLFHNIPYRGP